MRAYGICPNSVYSMHSEMLIRIDLSAGLRLRNCLTERYADDSVTAVAAGRARSAVAGLRARSTGRHKEIRDEASQALLPRCRVIGQLWSQTLGSDLVGTFGDPSGSVVPQAAVVATNRETNISYRAETDGSGNYIFTQFHPGPYALVQFRTARPQGRIRSWKGVLQHAETFFFWHILVGSRRGG
ncbi:MAG: carboxypeptidase-like regulatory domain-containing protein [Bryobacteraceae bacterium]